jgi:signal recognition particle subunit SRP19
MSRRVTIDEEFDDDTEIPLPSRPLPNMGTRGAILEEIDAGSDEEDDEEDDSISESMQPGPASTMQSQQAFMKAQAQMRAQEARTVDVTPYKT